MPNKAFFSKFIKLDKFEGADFKYDNIICKSQCKNTEVTHFWSQIWRFLFLHQLYNKTNSRTQISNMNIVISNSSLKIRKSVIFGPKFRHSCSRNFEIRQSRVVGFKYDNSIFKFHPKNMQIRYFWFQI